MYDFFSLFQKMVNGGTVNSWICINFSRNVQDSVASGFCYELAQMCYISGMVSEIPIKFFLLFNLLASLLKMISICECI